jgi:hypothetical protein
MMKKAIADRLMQMCEKYADTIAEKWYQALSTNPRTSSYSAMSKPACIRHATGILKNLTQMYFEEDCFRTVERFFDKNGFAEDNFARGIPLEEVFYALVLLRRHIWLYAEYSAMFDTAEDLYPLVQSVNRVLLVFDYATFITTQKYGKMAASHAGVRTR